MPTTTTAQNARIDSFKYRIGDRVVVEASGTVKVRDKKSDPNNENGQTK